jgi:nucleoside-diphosphate-sugar epimerase
MERYFNRLFQTDNFPVTIIRPSLTFGPGAANIGILRQNFGIIDRIRKGKPLIMFGDGTTPWNFTFAPDLAKGFVGVLKNKSTYGQAYHITNEDLHIWEDLYLEFGKLLGKEPIIRHIPAELLAKAAPNLCTHLYAEKAYASIYDNSKIRQDLPGYKADITLSEGLKGIIEWFEREADWVDPEKDALEDQLVAIYDQWASQMTNLYTK